MVERLKERTADFFAAHPSTLLLAVLALVAGFCGGSILFGQGPLEAIERLLFPTRFVYTSAGSAGDWYDVYQIDPPQDYDPHDFDGEVPERLIGLINTSQESIWAAAFELDLTPVAEALIAAHNRGVDVRWYTDDEHGLGSDADADNGQFKMMMDAGIPVFSDERDSLMHDKFIIFDNEIVWTGSTNLTRNGMFKNDNNVIIINSPSVAARYGSQFRELWQGKTSSERRSPIRRQTQLVEDTPLMILFAPEDNAMDLVIPLVKKAKESVHFMTFAFTHDDLGEELVRQSRRGVDVRGVFESRNATSQHSEIHRLYCAGVDVRADGNPANMHHKVFVIDGQVVITGSYNFSNNSENANDENMIFLNNNDIGASYEEEFERVWAMGSPPSREDIVCP